MNIYIEIDSLLLRNASSQNQVREMMNGCIQNPMRDPQNLQISQNFLFHLIH
jgi:hypothetical protein